LRLPFVDLPLSFILRFHITMHLLMSANVWLTVIHMLTENVIRIPGKDALRQWSMVPVLLLPGLPRPLVNVMECIALKEEINNFPLVR
jgi:hypothetical protein